MKRVLLVSMPFGSLDRPALGLSTLKPSLEEIGVSCDLAYLNFTFAELFGGEEYNWLVNDAPHSAFAGDWMFTEALYGPNPKVDRLYINDILRHTWHMEESSIKRIRTGRSLTAHFLDYCMKTIPWSRYFMVGFTSTFEQNISSLALAKRIKRDHPEILITFGGANWESEMGEELHAKFPFVDFVCPGEADLSFPALIKELACRKSREIRFEKIKGLIFRRNGKSISTGISQLVRDLDQLPMPDYREYFQTFEQSSASAHVVPSVLFESSRGCWWGAKSQCLFCGLNGDTITFRKKSPHRSLREIRKMVDTWQFDSIQAVDNIMDMSYFKEVLPALAGLESKLQLFYEVKANLRRKHIRLLRDAGVTRIQPGIESLNDHVLALMRKGTTAFRNIQMLKWAREYGISTGWNILYGFPGETRQDYSSQLSLLKKLKFLEPPRACGPVRLDRFSPLFKAHREYGLTNVRPMEPYKYLYPFKRDSLMRIAYFFDYDYKPEVDPGGHADALVSFVDEWQANPEKGCLKAMEGLNDDLILIDTRTDAIRKNTELAGKDREIYEYCDHFRTLDEVTGHMRGKYPGDGITKSRVAGFLHTLANNNLMVTDGTRFLSLAIS